jgi:hypothetical protein
VPQPISSYADTHTASRTDRRRNRRSGGPTGIANIGPIGTNSPILEGLPIHTGREGWAVGIASRQCELRDGSRRSGTIGCTTARRLGD